MSLMLLAVAAAVQVPERPADYAAYGSEPFWGLEIRGRRIVFTPHDGSESDRGISAILPRRRPTRNGYRLATPRFNVLVRHEICESEAERRYADTVYVRANGRNYAGCGGTLLAPDTLVNTDWRILTIGGARVSGDNYVMQFGENGQISGQAGCNRLNGSYSQRGNRLSAQRMIATRMACPGPRMVHERMVLQLLRGPVTITYPRGDIMVLTGSGVTIRLERT